MGSWAGVWVPNHNIISIAFSLLFGGKFSFFIDGQNICSGLVARALERTKVIFDRSPSHIVPADLAFYFDVEPPQRGSSNSAIVRNVASATHGETVEEEVLGSGDETQTYQR